MPSALANESLLVPSVRPRGPIARDSLVLSGVFGLLFFAPLAFGSTDAWATFILEAIAVLLFALWVWRQNGSGQPGFRGNPLFAPMAAFGAVVAMQLLFHWTSYRHDTYAQALLYLSYAILAFLVVQSLRRGSQAKTLAVAITAYGALVAPFALLQGLAPNGKIFWIRAPRFGGWIYGPYVNHNHYAGLMEMLVPIPLVFCLTRYARGNVRTAVAGIAALMASTIFFSGSRGGMIAFLAELILLGIVLVKIRRGTRPAAGFGVFAVLMLILLAWVGGAELSKRVGTIGAETRQEVSGGVRWTINKDGLRMFMHKPVLGWGLGTFPVAYPQFRTFYTHFFVNEAHNDYLQLLVETGLVGFLILGWFLARLYRNAFPKLHDWPDDINGAVTLACLLGCTGILVHSFVDFNLQVPANAAWFYVLSVLAASTEPLETRQRVRRQRSQALDMESEPSLPEKPNSESFQPD